MAQCHCRAQPAQLMAEVTFLEGMERLKPQANRAEQHTERPEGGGEPEGGQGGLRRGRGG